MPQDPPTMTPQEALQKLAKSSDELDQLAASTRNAQIVSAVTNIDKDPPGTASGAETPMLSEAENARRDTVVNSQFAGGNRNKDEGIHAVMATGRDGNHNISTIYLRPDALAHIEGSVAITTGEKAADIRAGAEKYFKDTGFQDVGTFNRYMDGDRNAHDALQNALTNMPAGDQKKWGAAVWNELETDRKQYAAAVAAEHPAAPAAKAPAAQAPAAAKPK